MGLVIISVSWARPIKDGLWWEAEWESGGPRRKIADYLLPPTGKRARVSPIRTWSRHAIDEVKELFLWVNKDSYYYHYIINNINEIIIRAYMLIYF